MQRPYHRSNEGAAPLAFECVGWGRGPMQSERRMRRFNLRVIVAALLVSCPRNGRYTPTRRTADTFPQESLVAMNGNLWRATVANPLHVLQEHH
jgi:hypothetical protein